MKVLLLVMALASNLLVPTETIDRYLASRGWSWQGLEEGRYGISLPQLQFHLIISDPVLFCERQLIERHSAARKPWQLFDYQKPSMRYRGRTIHECGAEVGKTREIVGLALWFLLTQKGGTTHGDGLIGAAQDGQLEDIWTEMLFQASASPWIGQQIDLDATKVKPYRKLVTRSGKICYLRPAGFDGRAFRGVHVGLFAFFDEAAIPDDQQVFSEFNRSAMPGCEIRYYSVPNGRRDTPFYRFCERAIPVDPMNLGAPRTDGKAIKIRWTKPMMPPPFWSAARREEFLNLYGSEDAPGYRHNVLGEWGDEEASVFPRAHFLPCLRYIPDYTCLKLQWDATNRRIGVHSYRLNPMHSPMAKAGEDEAAALPAQIDIVAATELSTPSDDERWGELENLIREHFPPRPGQHIVIGADFGSTDSHTEIGIWNVAGNHLRKVGRIQMRRWPYPDQARALRILYAILFPDHGMGLDSTGAGATVEQLLRETPADGPYLDDQISGFIFNAVVDEIDDQTGEPILDDNGRPRKISNKELATRLLELAMQNRQLEMPFDPDVVIAFPGHTVRETSTGRRQYRKENDHLVDEARCAILRVRNLNGSTAGEHHLSAFKSTGVRRDSTIIGELL